MKNTKSRKKMLISSVAMLLVALVALGSATYAWFTVSKTVTAENINVKAVATAGLEISKDDGNDYDTVVSFSGTQQSLKPVSYVPGGSGYIPDENVSEAKGADASYTGTYKVPAADSTPAIPAAVSADTGYAETSNAYFATYRVYIRSAEEAGKRVAHQVSATVKATSGSAVPFVRAALIQGDAVSAQDLKAVYGTKAGAETVCAGTANTKTGSVTVKAWNAGTDVADTAAVANATATDAGQAYTLVVWFEGTDPQCTDDLKNESANLTIEFTAKDM